MLCRHKVLACRTKEQHFFDRLGFLSPCQLEGYLGCYPERTSAHQLMIDVTPDYLARPWAAAYVARVLPHTQLLVLVRDPIARAFAAWKMQRRLGHEHRAFPTAIREELALLRDCPALSQSLLTANGSAAWAVAELKYTRNCAVGYCSWGSAVKSRPTSCQLLLYKGLYAEHIQIWLSFLSPQQILVVKTEALFQKPKAVLPKLQAFFQTKHVLVPSNKTCLHATAACDVDVKVGKTHLPSALEEKMMDYYRASQKTLQDMCKSFLLCVGVVEDLL